MPSHVAVDNDSLIFLNKSLLVMDLLVMQITVSSCISGLDKALTSFSKATCSSAACSRHIVFWLALTATWCLTK